MPPERPPRRTHPDSGNGGRGYGGRKNGVGGGSSTGDDDGDRPRRHCPRGVAMADVMMTMAGKRGGKATARQWRGNGKATATATATMTATRQQRGNKDVNAICYGAAGGRGNEAIDKRNQIILITNNQTLALIFFASFPHDTKVTSITNEMAIWTQC